MACSSLTPTQGRQGATKPGEVFSSLPGVIAPLRFVLGVKDECPNFDLRVALGLVAASEQMPTDQLDNFLIAQRFGPRTRF